MQKKHHQIPINNAFYDELNEMWVEGSDHPIALLRAENSFRNPWMHKVLGKKFPHPCKVLDIGCGGGLLTNFLAKKGHLVSGIDLSEQSLNIAKKQDQTQSVGYQRASAYELPFSEGTFDVVCAMSLLEHVEKPALVVAEASRVLKKGGLFFFHTLNRNFLSYLIIIKGTEWCFPHAPRHMHSYPLFIRPKELKRLCENQKLEIQEVQGIRPAFSKASFWKMLVTKKVTDNFSFVFTHSLKAGYLGYASRI